MVRQGERTGRGGRTEPAVPTGGAGRAPRAQAGVMELCPC